MLDVTMTSLLLRSFIFGITAVLFLTSDGTYGKVFTRCQAALELQRAGISRSWISNWVCLMEATSGFDSRIVTGPQTASSYSYGILQINSREWCTRGRRGGTCNARCEDFADDDIQDDIRCAKKIFDSRGFGGWTGWVRSCKNKPLPNVSQCRR